MPENLQTTAFLFPGYGSHRRGMGQGLFDSTPEFLVLEANIDDLLGYSIRRLCLDDPEDRLSRAQHAEPALYIVNALQYYKAIRDGTRPDFVAGHSQGEYNALLAAGVFDLFTGLRLVKRRSELIASAAPGSMAAVVGLDPIHVTELVRIRLRTIDIAHYNSPSQTTIAGPCTAVRRAGSDFENAGAQMYLPLPLEVPYHSRYLRRAASQYAEYLESFCFTAPKVPVISNVTARPYPQDSSRGIKTLLQKHITRPVNWLDTVRYLIGAGVTVFREIGPGDVLTRLCRQFHH